LSFRKGKQEQTNPIRKTEKCRCRAGRQEERKTGEKKKKKRNYTPVLYEIVNG